MVKNCFQRTNAVSLSEDHTMSNLVYRPYRITKKRTLPYNRKYNTFEIARAATIKTDSTCNLKTQNDIRCYFEEKFRKRASKNPGESDNLKNENVLMERYNKFNKKLECTAN